MMQWQDVDSIFDLIRRSLESKGSFVVSRLDEYKPNITRWLEWISANTRIQANSTIDSLAAVVEMSIMDIEDTK